MMLAAEAVAKAEIAALREDPDMVIASLHAASLEDVEELPERLLIRYHRLLVDAYDKLRCPCGNDIRIPPDSSEYFPAFKPAVCACGAKYRVVLAEFGRLKIVRGASEAPARPAEGGDRG